MCFAVCSTRNLFPLEITRIRNLSSATFKILLYILLYDAQFPGLRIGTLIWFPAQLTGFGARPSLFLCFFRILWKPFRTEMALWNDYDWKKQPTCWRGLSQFCISIFLTYRPSGGKDHHHKILTPIDHVIRLSRRWYRMKWRTRTQWCLYFVQSRARTVVLKTKWFC